MSVSQAGPRVDIGPKTSQQTVQPRITSIANTIVDLQDIRAGSALNSGSNAGIGLVDNSFGQANNGIIAGDIRGDPSPRRATLNVDLANQPLPNAATLNSLDTGLRKTSVLPSVTAPVQPSPAASIGSQPGAIENSQSVQSITSNVQQTGKVAEVPVTFGKSFVM